LTLSVLFSSTNSFCKKRKFNGQPKEKKKSKGKLRAKPDSEFVQGGCQQEPYEIEKRKDEGRKEEGREKKKEEERKEEKGKEGLKQFKRS